MQTKSSKNRCLVSFRNILCLNKLFLSSKQIKTKSFMKQLLKIKRYIAYMPKKFQYFSSSLQSTINITFCWKTKCFKERRENKGIPHKVKTQHFSSYSEWLQHMTVYLYPLMCRILSCAISPKSISYWVEAYEWFYTLIHPHTQELLSTWSMDYTQACPTLCWNLIFYLEECGQIRVEL